MLTSKQLQGLKLSKKLRYPTLDVLLEATTRNFQDKHKETDLRLSTDLFKKVNLKSIKFNVGYNSMNAILPESPSSKSTRKKLLRHCPEFLDLCDIIFSNRFEVRTPWDKIVCAIKRKRLRDFYILPEDMEEVLKLVETRQIFYYFPGSTPVIFQVILPL